MKLELNVNKFPNGSMGHIKIGFLNITQGTASHPVDVLKTKLRNIDGIFHEAALASVQDSFVNPEEYHDVNVNGTENIFKLAKEFGFLWASSS